MNALQNQIQSLQIQKILMTYKNEGLFTHAQCLAGSLVTGELTTDVALCADGSRVFDLASLSKALSTAPLVYLSLLERSLSHETATLGEMIRDWPKKLPDPFKSLLVKSLLQHRSGLPAWRNFWLGRLGVGGECCNTGSVKPQHDVIINKLKDIPVAGEQLSPVYSDIGFILLGMAVELVWGKSLPDLFQDKMKPAAGFNLVQYAQGFPAGTAFVPTAYCPIRQHLLIGEVHDENCAALGGATGHAGLFGTAAGVGSLLVSMYANPTLRAFLEINSNYIVKPEPDLPLNDSLFGLRQGSDRGAAGFAQGCAMGHLGFTGTAFWIDWLNKRFAILLTNRVISGRVNRAITSFRAEVFAALN